MEKEKTATKPNILMKRQEDQELRIYFFIGNKPVMVNLQSSQPTQPETKVFYVVAFKLEEAFDLVKVKGEGFNMVYTAQNPTVREFLHELELESLAFELLEKEKPKTLEVEEKEPAKKEPVDIKIDLTPAKVNFEKFKAELLYCANEKTIIYQNKEDKEILKQIVSGLRYRA